MNRNKIIAMTAAVVCATGGLSALWVEANRVPNVGNADVTWSESVMSDADRWVVCVEESEPTDANLRACDDTFGAHDMRVLRP